MRRGTTPTLILTIKNVDLTGSELEVALKQSRYFVIKKNNDLHIELDEEDTVVSLYLTQEETLSFSTQKMLSIQVRFIDEDGVAGATNIKQIPVDQILREGVIEYGGLLGFAQG